MKTQVFNFNDLARVSHLYPPVKRAGYVGEAHFFRKRRIDDFQIAFQLDGTAVSTEINIDGRIHQADFPRILIKRPGELHQIPHEGVVTSFFFTYASDEFFRDRIPSGLVLFHLDYSQNLMLLFNRFMRLTEHIHEYGISDRIDALCMAFTQEVVLAFDHWQNPPSEFDNRIRKVISYMRMHFDEDISLEKLSRRFSYSLRSLNRHWRDCRPDTPGQYLLNLRMTEARRLLLETDLTVNEIAGKMQYSQSAYFIRAFRRCYGVTPFQYRRSSE